MTDLHEPALDDLDARRQAATTFDRPVTVEAGAGTGKTTLLVHRLLVWALEVGWRTTSANRAVGGTTSDPEPIASRLLDRIVAITFTEAAAAELADRFVAAIAGAVRNELPVGFQRRWLSIDDATMAERARWLLPQVDRTRITTIHAWCYEMLRRHPYDAGVHPELAIVADAQEIEAVAREVIEEQYRRAYQGGVEADLLLLGEEKLGPRDWVEIVRQWVVAGWEVETHLPEADGTDDYLDQVRACAAELVAADSGGIADLGGRNLGPRVLDAARETAGLDGDSPDQALGDLREIWQSNLKTHLAKWASVSFNQTERNALPPEHQRAIADAAAPLSTALAVIRAIDPQRWRRRQRVLRAAIRDTEAALHEESSITFGGLLRQAAHLLTTHADVAASERSRIDLLMVDEFQDTDALQASLVETLALADPAGDAQVPPGGGAQRDAADESEAQGRATRQRRPSLILVGDPKQSIYGWRNADLETYERIRRRVIDRGGVELVLSSNFRSSSTVLAATDAIVGSQMQLDPGFQPQYHRLVAGAEHATQEPAPVSVLRFAADSAAEQARNEAEWVASDIAGRRVAGELTLDQTAILMRSKTHVRSVLRALRAAGLAYEVSADVGFHERSEVIDGAAWVRVIADPEDQVALLKILRSPTVGMPDAALAAAWKPLLEEIRAFSQPNPRVEAKIRDILTRSLDGVSEVPGLERICGWADYATDRLAQIGSLRRDLRREPFAEFIDRLRDATNIEAIEARRPEGEARVANLVKLFDQLIQQVEETGGDTHAVLRVLRRGIYFELPAEEAVPLKPIDGAVQVASIHAAKGLEFDQLYLVHFGMGGGRDDTELQVEAAIPGATIIKGVAHPRWALGRQRRGRVADAEALRLLYVALTRARRRLVICLPTGSRAGTLGSLVENGLAAAGSKEVEAAIAEQTVDAWSDPAEQAAAAGGDDVLPNPEWSPPPDPPPLHDSPTNGSRVPGFAPSVSDETTASAGPAFSHGPSASRRGTTVHGVLAEIDLATAEPRLPARWRDDAVAREFWATFSSTALKRRLLSLGERLRGREVEVLSPSGLLEHDSAAAYAGGKIDLVYVDKDGRWVIADYKTGEPQDLAAAVTHHAPQLRYYGQALASALDLDRPPRLELWFLDLDRVAEVTK